MGETILYTDSQGREYALSGDARFRNGNLDAWHVTPVWTETVGDTDEWDGYGGFGHVEWNLHFAVTETSYTLARQQAASWRRIFMRDVSRGERGTITVIHDGQEYTIDAAHVSPEVEGPDGAYVGIVLKFQSESPFWSHVQLTGTASFAGTATADVTWNNPGDYKSWPTHIIDNVTTALGTPKIEDVGSGDYIEIGTTIPVDGVVYVWTNPPLIRYYAGGTSAGDQDEGANWTKYCGTVSTFWGVQVEGGTARISAASGTADYEMQYHVRRAGIGEPA